jgi:hypothetical protein
MQHMFNNFNILKVNGSIDVHMLKIEEMCKKSLTHSSINVKS